MLGRGIRRGMGKDKERHASRQQLTAWWFSPISALGLGRGPCGYYPFLLAPTPNSTPSGASASAWWLTRLLMSLPAERSGRNLLPHGSAPPCAWHRNFDNLLFPVVPWRSRPGLDKSFAEIRPWFVIQLVSNGGLSGDDGYGAHHSPDDCGERGDAVVAVTQCLVWLFGIAIYGYVRQCLAWRAVALFVGENKAS